MRRHAPVAVITFSLATGLATQGCVSGDETMMDDPVAEQTSSAIQGGNLETGFPTVGMLQFFKSDGLEYICTASLVSQSWVVSAAHCTGTSMRFRTGTNWNDFVDHPVDQQIKHPTLDLALFHLADPIEGVPPLKLNPGAAPAVGAVCMIVGFGDHGPPATATNGIKRSATARITFSGPTEIVATWETGITDGGDSGGPLLCTSGIIAAVDKSHEDGDFPAHKTSSFTPIDLAWANSTIAPSFTELTLQNGWSHSLVVRNASAALVSGKVHMKGGIVTQGTNAVPFTLPAAFRPATDVIVPVDLCSGAKGSLLIKPTGVTTVRASAAWSDAQCQTSLEGVTYAVGTAGYTALTLQNGWKGAPSSTAVPGIRDIGGIVHLRGAIASGTNNAPFTIPTEYRPPNTVSAPVTLCNGKVGRLTITTAGAATIQAEGALSDAQCMTSLEGVTYARGIAGFTSVFTQNGWTRAGNGAAPPEIAIVDEVVHLRGAISTTGTAMTALFLGGAYTPPAPVYIPVTLCSGKKGRLEILPSGDVTVFGQGALADAQCVSLEGASYVLSDFTPVTLENYWQNAPFSTNRVGFSVSQGLVHLRGAMGSTATAIDAFTLPPEARPSSEVYLPVSLCNAVKGRLHISTGGLATVSADGPWTDAQCLVSLDGLSYPVSTSGYTALTLKNSWLNAPFATRNAVAKDIGGYVHLAGAISSGTASGVFQLPTGLRPSSVVYVTTDLCNARKGRLQITPDGNVVVEANVAFADATCFTSLEGVTFAKSSGTATTLTLVNGWSGAPYNTRVPAAQNDKGIIRLQGAMASGQQQQLFTLPLGMRPKRNVYVTADLCSASRGRLFITTDGSVFVNNASGTFNDTAACFTSLEGIWYPQGN